MPEGPARGRVDRFWRVLALLLIVAAGVRVGYVAGAKRGPCPNPVVGDIPTECALGDQLYYNSAANRLAAGDGFVEPFDTGPDPAPAADHPPLTIMVLAPVSWLADRAPLDALVDDPTHLLYHRYAMALLGTGLVLLIGLLGREIGGDRVGWLAAGIAAVYPFLWVNDGLVFSETVANLTVVGALLLGARLVRRPRLVTAIGLGVMCGLATLARAELALLVPLVVVPAALLARSTDRRARAGLAGAAVVAAGIVVAPWVLYNLSRFEEPVFVSTNIGIALAGSNCDPVYYGGGIGLTYLDPPCIDDPHPPGDQSEVARVYQRRAVDYARDHAGRVPAVVAARVGRTWSLYRPDDMITWNENEGRETWVTRLGLWMYYPLLALAAAGTVVMFRRRDPRRWVLLAPAIVVTVSSALIYGQTRFRAPAEPGLVVLAAVAVAALLARRRPAWAPRLLPPGTPGPSGAGRPTERVAEPGTDPAPD